MADKKPVLLVVEDDPGLQAQLKWAYEDFDVIIAGDRATAMSALRAEEPAVVTLDLGLPPDADGVTRTVLSASDGTETEVWQDGDWQWLQLFITRSFPTARGPVTAIAVEPMTAPADALNSGLGLRWIEPGATWAGFSLREYPAGWRGGAGGLLFEAAVAEFRAGLHARSQHPRRRRMEARRPAGRDRTGQHRAPVARRPDHPHPHALTGAGCLRGRLR